MPRNTVIQQLNQKVIAVGLTPTPLSDLALQSAYIDSFLLCLYSTAANSVFFGDATVTTTNGMEIPVGVTVQFAINNERPLYELQSPLLQVAGVAICDGVPPVDIPFVYWDLSQLFLIAAAATNVTIIPFKRAYV